MRLKATILRSLASTLRSLCPSKFFKSLMLLSHFSRCQRRFRLFLIFLFSSDVFARECRPDLLTASSVAASSEEVWTTHSVSTGDESIDNRVCIYIYIYDERSFFSQSDTRSFIIFPLLVPTAQPNLRMRRYKTAWPKGSCTATERFQSGAFYSRRRCLTCRFDSPPSTPLGQGNICHGSSPSSVSSTSSEIASIISKLDQVLAAFWLLWLMCYM